MGIDRNNNTTHTIYVGNAEKYNEKTAISQLRDAYTTVGPLEPPLFGVKEQKCLTDYKGRNEEIESQFPKLKTLNHYRDIATRT